MTICKIDFNKTVSFLGRNGKFKSNGIELYESSYDNITISPITSRGSVGSCYIEIPKEEIDNFITLLQRMK